MFFSGISAVPVLSKALCYDLVSLWCRPFLVRQESSILYATLCSLSLLLVWSSLAKRPRNLFGKVYGVVLMIDGLGQIPWLFLSKRPVSYRIPETCAFGWMQILFAEQMILFFEANSPILKFISTERLLAAWLALSARFTADTLLKQHNVILYTLSFTLAIFALTPSSLWSYFLDMIQEVLKTTRKLFRLLYDSLSIWLPKAFTFLLQVFPLLRSLNLAHCAYLTAVTLLFSSRHCDNILHIYLATASIINARIVQNSTSVTRLCRYMALPWTMITTLWHKCLCPLMDLVLNYIDAATRLAARSGPYLTILAVLIPNLFVLYLPWPSMITISIPIDDTRLVLVLIAVINARAAEIAYGCLHSQSILDLDTTPPTNTDMDDPRQCARCLYGPVDSFGCADLTSSTARNHCPRCGWFATTLHQWPYYNQPVTTHHIARIRLFSQAHFVSSAAIKATAISYWLLRFFTQYSWLGISLAGIYLLPWLYENSPFAYRSFFYPPIYPARSRGQINISCSVSTVQPQTRRRGEYSRNIMDMHPNLLDDVAVSKPGEKRILLSAGDTCPICLEDFDSTAIKLAANNADPSSFRLQCRPPIILLRCGHPLHIKCAETYLSHSLSAGISSRHLRCPLCRQVLLHSVLAVAF